jgi:succinate dehydrogenase / fumarate reductase, cytochrome b subunit
MSAAPKPRPKYYDLSLAHLPPPGLVSILHRISGILLFFPIVPALLWMLQGVIGSEEGFARWRDVFREPAVKVVVVLVAWAYAHHFWAGIRYLLLDLHYHVMKEPARRAAQVVLALGVLTALVVAWRVW